MNQKKSATDPEEKVRVLECYRCSYVWVPRKDGVPDRCPRCRSIKWSEPGLGVKCLKCGHEWNSHKGDPKRCPACGTHQWNTPQVTVKCLKCGFEWSTRSNRTPKRCPECRSKDWNTESRRETTSRSRAKPKTDEATRDEVLSLLAEGKNLTEISIITKLSYGSVYAIARNEGKL